jgi:succinoglycan biosynthesis transport protein ExoP
MQTSKNESAHLRNYLIIILKRKWTILTFLTALVTVVMIVSFKMEPIYQATCQLLIEKERPDAVSFEEVIGIDTLDQDYYQTQYKILKSRSLAKGVIQELDLEHIEEFSQSRPKPNLQMLFRKTILREALPAKSLDIEGIIDRFLSAIEIEPVRNTRLVEIKAKSRDPGLATHMANTLAQTYLSQNLEYKLFASRQVLDKLLPQKGKTEFHSEDINLNELVVSLPSVVNHPLIQKLKERCAELEVSYATLSKRYGPRHPKVISVKSALNEMKENINLETKRILSAVKTELSGNLKSSNIRIIDLAQVPKKPISPNKGLNLILSLTSGLILGCGLAFFFEYWDNTFKAEEDVEGYLGLLFLGHIPTIRPRGRKKKAEKNIFVHTYPKSAACEAFRNIRTGIDFSHSSNPVKTILISSAGPQEGKTLIAVNLAISMAQADNKVLLVDTDMRRSTMHRILKLNNYFGLSDYFKGESELGKLVQDTFIENLKCICCGPSPSNPSELLGSIKMKELIEAVRNSFDKIIFDSPPVLSVTDSLVLGKAMDGVIQVVRFGKYPRDMIYQAKQRLQEMEIKVIGVVLNDIDIERSGRYYYPYYYRYYHKGYYDEGEN